MSGQRARERTRRTYTPEELRVLFIGESPPSGGTFFYDANSILYFATREAFLTAAPRLATRASFLDTFQQLGCYLEDLSLRPIDKLPKPEKRRARETAVPTLAGRLKGLAPRLVVVVAGASGRRLTTRSTGPGSAPFLARHCRFPGSGTAPTTSLS
jgi:hypothetical protein